MEHKLVSANDKHSVYTQAGKHILVTNVNKTGFAPGVAYVLVPIHEFEAIKALVAKCKTEGVARKTAQNKDALDLSNESYKVSIITTEKGHLVDVRVLSGELEGLSLLWNVDSTGNTVFRNNDKFVWFSPSGVTYFDFGFERVKAKIGRQRFNSTSKAYDMEFGEPQWLTVPTQAGSEAMARACHGMQVLEGAVDFAQSQLAPEVNAFQDVPFDMTVDFAVEG